MWVAIAAVWVCLSAVALGEPATLVGDGVSVTEDTGNVLVSVDLSRTVPWSVTMADGPPRLVLELQDVQLGHDVSLRSSSIGDLAVVPTGVNAYNLNALLREPLSILSAEMVTSDSGAARLNVVLEPTTANDFRSALQADDAPPLPQKVIVAIDPGHGGRDPGAEVDGMREADLVLGFAFRLRDALLASNKFDVVLTRETDEFVSLDARLTRARDAGGDILISLHADALEDVNAASGIVVYRLADDAGAAADQRLLERHAPADQLSGVDLTDAGDDAAQSLLALARLEAYPRSRDLSAKLVAGFRSAGLKVNSRPERVGAFTVLKSADIPSVLIELGFLSTDDDLQRLTSAEWQIGMAEAMRDALLLWADEDRLR